MLFYYGATNCEHLKYLRNVYSAKLINLPCGFSFLTPDLWRPVLVQIMKIKLHYKSVLQAVFHIVLFCVVAIVWCQA